MASFIDPFINAVDSLLEWLSGSLHQVASSYVELETAYSKYNLVAKDGSLVSIIKVKGIRFLLGGEEFSEIASKLNTALNTGMSHPGHSLQFLFSFDNDGVKEQISNTLIPAISTADRLNMQLDDLFSEKINYLSNYCSKEDNYIVLWTNTSALTKQQLKSAMKKKGEMSKKNRPPLMKDAQNLTAAIHELNDIHNSFVKSLLIEMQQMGLDSVLLNVYESLYHARMTIDPTFTSCNWQPYLPGDKIPVRDIAKKKADVSDVMWPTLAEQVIPRDGENIDRRVCRIGDKIFAPIFISLFPKEIQIFNTLFGRCLSTGIPWRVSFQIDSGGLSTIGFKATVATVLSWASSENKLISDAKNLLSDIDVNTDSSVVRLKVMLCTWAPQDKPELLRIRIAELSKAVQGWGTCDTGELTGDPYGGVLSSALAVNTKSLATPSIAPLPDVVKMLPFTRPSSPWMEGAVLFRSPDGKLWPFQPGSTQQTTWIDLIYARPGSGKSVLSNSINLALCLSGGLQRLPRIAIIDIGPSSSGLISLIQEALPDDKRHMAAYHRLRMTPDYSINPFDTQLGCRLPTPLERSFLVNFITLLATPIGDDKPYDGITDMAGMVVDEMFIHLKDDQTPNLYTAEIEPIVDSKITDNKYELDSKTSWWEITDQLFKDGCAHEAMLAQRYAVPIVADAAAIVRGATIQDLFGKIIAPTGEPLIQAFSRMISSAIREYPILARPTKFDLGESKIVSLDLDEVAKTGGAAAERQTAVMYMLARYILGKDFYLTLENVSDMPEEYREYHSKRIKEIREDPKRIVLDEFHRTSKAQAVRDQVIVDMREGRKWKVQVALLSQALEDFDSVMVDFATSIYIMDAGAAQTIDKTKKTFGLSSTATEALRTRVHGPRAGGGTFLAQFATKTGLNTQLITNTLGPVELWSFSTTAEDTKVRNELYTKIGPKNARRVLANMYPSGSVAKVVEQRLSNLKEQGLMNSSSAGGVIDELIAEILEDYRRNPI